MQENIKHTLYNKDSVNILIYRTLGFYYYITFILQYIKNMLLNIFKLYISKYIIKIEKNLMYFKIYSLYI